MDKLGSRLGRIVEHNAAERVEAADRRPWIFFAAIQIGTAICVPMFALGGDLGSHSRFIALAPAVLTGSLIIALLGIATAFVGMTARVPTAVLTRVTFGTAGAQALAFILVLTLLGWFGIQTEMLARALTRLLKDRFALDVPLRPVIIAGGILISTTGIIGFRALGKLAYLAVPFLLAIITVPLWIAVARGGVAEKLAAPAMLQPYSFGMVVSILTGGYMTGVALVPDIARFLRSPRDVLLGPIVSFGLALPFLLLLSASLSVLYGTGDLVGIMMRAGLATPALLVLILATWTSNDKNLYESALSLSALLPRYPRWLLAIVAAAVGIGLAVAGIFAHFIQWLILMGLLIAPVPAIYTIDFLSGRHRYAAAADGAQPRLRPLPFAAWALGSLLGWTTLPVESGGLGLFRLTAIPTLDALGGAGLCYALLRVARGLPGRS